MNEDRTGVQWAFLEIDVSLPSGRQVQYILNAEEAPNFVLGRKSEILIDDEQVSQVHAMMFFDAGTGWQIKDLHSTNGTYVNGNRIDSAVGLQEADLIKVGGSTIRVCDLSAAGAGGDRTTSMAAWESPSRHILVRDVVITIDEAQRARDVQDLVGSDFFQKLRDRTRHRRSTDPS